jgi:hypothetical protein
MVRADGGLLRSKRQSRKREVVARSHAEQQDGGIGSRCNSFMQTSFLWSCVRIDGRERIYIWRMALRGHMPEVVACAAVDDLIVAVRRMR